MSRVMIERIGLHLQSCHLEDIFISYVRHLVRKTSAEFGMVETNIAGYYSNREDIFSRPCTKNLAKSPGESKKVREVFYVHILT